MASTPDPAPVRRKILLWYSKNGRAFPWRETRDPYRILLSEIMLQQTQAERVAVRLPEFLKAYPDMTALSRAPKADVLRAWKGMGYNNRAVRLHSAVKEVMAAYNGVLPRETDALEALPGIGRYTAHAVACFAHGRRLPVVDVNVRRVLSRIFRRMDTTGDVLSEKEAWELASAVLPAAAYDWNQALMDFGALICTARSPKCSSCPLAGTCRSGGRFRSAGHAPPGRKPKPEPSHRGIPRRIWRGKIVGALRDSGKALAPTDLLRVVRPSGRAPSGKWLDDLIARLERDGVVSVRRSRGRTSVSLAS